MTRQTHRWANLAGNMTPMPTQNPATNGPTLTREEIAKHKTPCHPLSLPVRGWEIGKGGAISAECVIPAGASLVSGFPEVLRSLLARYGEDRSVGDFLLPDGQIVSRLYRLTDALKALPEEVPDVRWCTETQTYEPAGSFES